MNNDFENNKNGGSQENTYRSMSYEEAAAMREKVKEGAYQKSYEEAMEQKERIKNGEYKPKAERHYYEDTKYDAVAKAASAEMFYHADRHRDLNTSRSSTASDGIAIFRFIALVAIIGMISTLYLNIPYMIAASETAKYLKTFPTVEGTIIESKGIQTNQNTPNHRAGVIYHDRWRVSYTYEYEGETLECSQYFSMKKAQELGFTYDSFIGRSVTVYVDPDRPNESIIAKSSLLEFSDWLPMIFSFFILLIGVFIQNMFARGKFTIDYVCGKKTIRPGNWYFL